MCHGDRPRSRPRRWPYAGSVPLVEKGGDMQPGPFRDRHEAGRQLAEKLASYANRPDVLVLALPRGGVPVAYEVARALGAPLDVFVVRKLWALSRPAASACSMTTS